MASRTAANYEGYRQIGDGYALTGLLACTSAETAAGRTAATVVLPGLLAPDVPSGQGFQPVKGSVPG